MYVDSSSVSTAIRSTSSFFLHFWNSKQDTFLIKQYKTFVTEKDQFHAMYYELPILQYKQTNVDNAKWLHHINLLLHSYNILVPTTNLFILWSFLNITPCGAIDGFQHFRGPYCFTSISEDWGSRFLQDNDNHRWYFTVSKDYSINFYYCKNLKPHTTTPLFLYMQTSLELLRGTSLQNITALAEHLHSNTPPSCNMGFAVHRQWACSQC